MQELCLGLFPLIFAQPAVAVDEVPESVGCYALHQSASSPADEVFVYGASLPAITSEDQSRDRHDPTAVGVVSGGAVLPEGLHVGAQEVERPLKTSPSGVLQRGGTSGGI